jgi:glycosyltransferase involved in cell wall biosynthesis
MSDRSVRSGLRIAMIGQRGIPATFGGIEHHVEQLGARLVERGHEVTVFCRTNYTEDRRPRHRGMRLHYLPTVTQKHLDAVVHSGLSSCSSLRGRFDVVHYHALGPGLMAPLPRFASPSGVVLTVHGLDDERAKWGRGAQAVLRTAQWMSARVPNATIVVSGALQQHYRRVHGRSTFHIPNGVVPPTPRAANEIRSRFGLEPGSYVLFVGRLVPEKAPDVLVEAFRSVPQGKRLVIAGGSSFTNDYVTRLERIAADDPRVSLVGYVYGDTLAELYSNAAAFVLPSLLEGLPLTLLEAASYGLPIIASSIPPHLEVLGQDRPGHQLVIPGDVESLSAALRSVLAGGGTIAADAASLQARVVDRYSWDKAADATEDVYDRVVSHRLPLPVRSPDPMLVSSSADARFFRVRGA